MQSFATTPPGPEPDPAPPVSRSELLANTQLEPVSLIGSWFIVLDGVDSLVVDCDPNVVWIGQIVAEPAHGVYLAELHDSLPFSARAQRLVRLEQMTQNPDQEWRFFDTEEAMRLDYATLSYQFQS